MAGVDELGLCGVPRFISNALEWGDNGVISLPSAPGERMVFYESETIDALFDGIKELIGMPIDNIVIESRRRETRRYMEGVFPRQITEQVKSGTVGDREPGRDRQALQPPGQHDRQALRLRRHTG